MTPIVFGMFVISMRGSGNRWWIISEKINFIILTEILKSLPDMKSSKFRWRMCNEETFGFATWNWELNYVTFLMLWFTNLCIHGPGYLLLPWCLANLTNNHASKIMLCVIVVLSIRALLSLFDNVIKSSMKTLRSERNDFFSKNDTAF